MGLEILTLIPTWPEPVRGVPNAEGGKAITQVALLLV